MTTKKKNKRYGMLFSFALKPTDRNNLHELAKRKNVSAGKLIRTLIDNAYIEDYNKRNNKNVKPFKI